MARSRDFSFSVSSTLSLAQKAVRDKVIDKSVLFQLKSLNPQVPKSMKHRYLLAHIQANIRGLDREEENYIKYKDILRDRSDIADDLGDILFVPESLCSLLELLIPYAHKWRSIGTALKFCPHNLDKIEACAKFLHDAPNSYLAQVLEDWLYSNFEYTLPPTKKHLEAALKSQTVGLAVVASKLGELDIQCEIPTDDAYAIMELSSESSSFPVPKILLPESTSTLLEVRAVGCSYNWFKDGKAINQSDYFFSCEAFLYLHEIDIEHDGCEIYCEVDSVKTNVIIVNVSCPLDKFRKSLATLYLVKPEVPEDTWPPVSSKKFVNLALIKQRRMNPTSDPLRFTIRGDADDILQCKDKIEYDEVFRRLKSKEVLMIEGRPGCGKTTLVHKISQDWASESGGAIRLALLVSLRVINTLNKPNLSDILKLFRDLKVSQELLEERDGKGVCFIFDGLDEYLPPDGRKSIV